MNIFSKIIVRKETFPALTGIRAIAAFMIFFHHLRLNLGPGFLVGLQLSLYWGVTLFFVLSGFLMAYRYYETSELSGKWLFNYFVNRFARIYPVYFLVLTAVVFLSGNFDTIFLVQNYTLTQNLFFIFKSHGTAIAPSWSLTVEECFYLLAPLIFLLCKKYNLYIPFIIIFLLLGLVLVSYKDDSSIGDGVFRVFSGSFLGHCVEFFAGIYLALYLLKKNEKTVGHSKSMKWTTVGLAGIVMLAVLLEYVVNKEDKVKYPVIVVVNNFLLPLPIAAFYYGLITEKSWCKRILSSGLMRVLGRSSYAFYLLHLPVIDYLGTPFIRPYFDGGGYNLYVIIIFFFTILLSVIVFVFIEDPLNMLIRRRLRRQV
jgi:peptidoglycan/LPS O-acetylase OafA/YrhL